MNYVAYLRPVLTLLVISTCNGDMAAAVIPAVAKLSNRVVRILGFNPGPMTLQGTNTYLIGTGKDRILLDTGEKDIPDYTKCLSDVLKKEQVNVKHILITHWHNDHIGGVEDIYNNVTTRPIVWKHKRSVDDAEDTPLPKGIPLNWLENEQQIEVAGATLKAYHTPGHTTDHVVFLLKEDNVLFSGDCILGEGTAVFEDLYTYMKSLHKILELEPNLIYPGHGNIIEDPKPKIEYYIQHRNQREQQIFNTLKSNVGKPLNEMDLVKLIYSETPEHLWPAAAYNVNHHLTKLTKEGKIQCLTVDGETKWQFVADLSAMKNNKL